MNAIDKTPSKCRNCPYWELASYPWCCGDCADKMNPENSKYIKRIDAKRALTALPPDLDAETIQRCIEAMNNPKAADVEPMRHGRWIPINRSNPSWSQFGIAQHKCSECGSEEMIARKRCPECGAKMDKEADNGTA